MMFNPMPSPLTVMWMPCMLPLVIWAECVQAMCGQTYAVQQHFEAKRRRIPQGYTPDLDCRPQLGFDMNGAKDFPPLVPWGTTDIGP